MDVYNILNKIFSKLYNVFFCISMGIPKTNSNLKYQYEPLALYSNYKFFVQCICY